MRREVHRIFCLEGVGVLRLHRVLGFADNPIPLKMTDFENAMLLVALVFLRRVGGIGRRRDWPRLYGWGG
jgi:hypothetical protein